MGRDSLPGCWRDFADALDAGIDRIVLYGPSGTGKTYAALREGVGAPGAHRLVCTEDMTAADVTGCWMPTAGGQFEWLDGAAVRAWRGDGERGGRLVVDEADRAAGDVLALLLAVCDTDGSARFDHPATGAAITPLPGFTVVMTTNLGVSSWGKIFDDPMVAAAMLDRLLHRSVVFNIDGESYRMRSHRARTEGLRKGVAKDKG